MILDLDLEGSLDPGRVGSKAARLALGRQAGLPVLPGVVVEAAESSAHMRLGAGKLSSRGSGGARLAITAEPLLFADELVQRGSELGDQLVARSSTLLESSGVFSGAFTSYLELLPADLPRAVTGCWASAFSVAALERQDAASIAPGSFPMAVLIQPGLDPIASGTARLDDDGTVTVHGVKGSPAPLLQGWATGHEGSIGGLEGTWTGAELIDLLGMPVLDEIAALIRQAQETTGANHCEWALEDRVWLLQLDELARPEPAPSPIQIDLAMAPELSRLAGIVGRAAGRLGERFLLPWALAGLPREVGVVDQLPSGAVDRAEEMSLRLTAETWGLPADEAMEAARHCMSLLLGPDPGPALELIRRLRTADPNRSAELVALVEALERAENGRRRGVGRWEPFLASVALATGVHHQGTPAAAGVGAGRLARIGSPGDAATFPRRGIIYAPQPIPNLAPLLWDAAGLVTASGSPAAHLFESARALGVPAVCGARLPVGDQMVAVNGHTGVAATLGQ